MTFTPGTLNLVAYRNVPFIKTIRFVGYDFTGDTSAKMQVRLYRGATGDPLISLEVETAGTEGLSWVVTDEDGVDVSTLTIQIDEATVDACLPWPGNGQASGTDVAVVHDIIIDGGGVPKNRWYQGSFTIREGATV
jgi:hypothetical protein